MTLADRRFRRFFAARGYPDPASITQERTIWPAGATACTPFANNDDGWHPTAFDTTDTLSESAVPSKTECN
jgi:hypothetical protein